MNFAAADDRGSTFGLTNGRADGEPIGAPAHLDDIQVSAAQRRGWRSQTEREDQQGAGEPDRRVHVDIVLNGPAGYRPRRTLATQPGGGSRDSRQRYGAFEVTLSCGCTANAPD